MYGYTINLLLEIAATCNCDSIVSVNNLLRCTIGNRTILQIHFSLPIVRSDYFSFYSIVYLHLDLPSAILTPS